MTPQPQVISHPIKESYHILLSLVSRYFYHAELFHPGCFEGTSTSSHSFGRRVDKQASRLPFEYGDDPVILNVDGLVAYARVSGHAGQLAWKGFNKNSRSAGIGFIATQGHKFLFCGYQAVSATKAKKAEALAIFNAIDFANQLKEKYKYQSLVIVEDCRDSIDFFMGKHKVPPIQRLYFNNIESIVQKSGLKFDAIHR